jgi:hypothetical protein
MTMPEYQAAAVRLRGNEESTSRRPRGVLDVGSGESVSGADAGERPGDRSRVLPRARGLLPDRGTAAFPTVVLTVVAASAVSPRALW